MKRFKEFLLETESNAKINQMLQDYVNGKIEDYDNTGSFIELFDPNGKGIPKLLSNFNLSILDKFNDTYKGKDLVNPKVETGKNMVFKIGDSEDTTKFKTLVVTLGTDKNDKNLHSILSAEIK